MDCPTCGKSLSTERGMRQHHAKVHGEPLPNRVCKGCETEFYDPKARRTFCEDCYSESGSHNGNWKDAKETAECMRCDTEFEYYPSNKDGVYCSRCVDGASGLLPDNPAYRVEPTFGTCSNCDTAFRLSPSRLHNRKRGVFCDQACYGEWLSENVVGEGHHQWEGGTISYGRLWWRIRRQALVRDEYTCQLCGADSEVIGRKPDVHHITRVRDFDDPQSAHCLDNVVTLCRSCHRNVEEGNAEVPSRSTKK